MTGLSGRFARLCVALTVFLTLAACDQSGAPEDAPPPTSKDGPTEEGTDMTAQIPDAASRSPEADQAALPPSVLRLVEDPEVKTFARALKSDHQTRIQRVISPGGVEAWLVEEHSVPLIALELGFKGGARRDPAGREGLAYMLSGLLDEGAGDLDSQAFQTRLEDLSIRLRFNASLDGFYGSLRTLSRNRDQAFDLLRLALTVPRFDDEPVARIRSQIQVLLKRDATQPRTIARNAWFRTVLGDHPYAHPVHGTAESIAAVTVEDLRRFMREALARDVLKISVVGDITADELAPLLDQTFGALPERAAPEHVPPVRVPEKGRLVVIEREQPQSVAIFGGPGLVISDPDFIPAYVMNYILGGGGFASRLMEEVREKRGLAYGVSTFLSAFEYGGVMLGTVATENSRIKDSLDIIKAEIRRMAEEGVTEQELQNAKTYLTGSFALRFDSNSSIANQLVGYQLTGRGIDYIDRRNALIEAVNRDDIARVARRLLSPEALTVVVVGEPVGLEE